MFNDNNPINILRPNALSDFVGREAEKKVIKMMIDSAKARADTVDHILLYGPPGLGKTTLATLIAKEMGANIVISSAPAITSKSDLASILMNLSEGDILFIDEIHRLSTVIEEFLYPVMEDFMMDITMGKGMMANVVRVPLKKFTLIGATTKISNISDPLKDRFGLLLHLEFYTDKEIEDIIERSCRILNISLDKNLITLIAQRSRGVARIANKIVKFIRDYIIVNSIKKLSEKEIEQIFDEMGIDSKGLDKMDRKILSIIYTQFNSGPVSLSTLVAALSQDKKTIEDYYEPHLIKLGLLQKTTRGRVITIQGVEHIKKYI